MSSRAESKPTGDLSICVAIDKSGSTYGETLREEIEAVQNICSLLSPRNENPVRLLPWCNEALPPICLPKESTLMRNLESRGGTNPKVLYSSAASLHALSSCGLWFLLTDGEIENSLVQDFAIATAELGLHGLACIIVIFGSTLLGPPANCNISVGLATYAVAPDCLFLFQDVATGSLSILQAKGCFKELLPRSESSYIQPVINIYTTWGELPHISYKDLSRIRIAPPKKLDVDEIALQEDLTVRMRDLYCGAVDDESVAQIIKNEDNLISIAMAETTRGNSQELQKWLAEQERPEPELTRHRTDIRCLAQRTVTELLECLESSGNNAKAEGLRERLREAHGENRRHFQKVFSKHTEQKAMIQNTNEMCRRASEVGYTIEHAPIRRISAISNYYYETDQEISQNDEPDFLFLPGFQRGSSSTKKEFVARCMLCHGTSVLAILLKTSPEISTTNFPRRGSLSRLAFPLAMGGFAETDVVSFFLSCDACALYLIRNFKSPNSETITGALPLASLELNKAAWLSSLEATFKGRFQSCDLNQLLVAILDKKIIDNKNRNASPDDIELCDLALRWTKRSLLAITQVPVTLSSSFGHRGSGPHRSESLLKVVSDRTLLNPADAQNAEIAILRYPLPGFMVIIRLMCDEGNAQSSIRTYLFQRLLFHFTEVYLTFQTDDGKTALNAIDKMLCRNPRDLAALSQSDSVPGLRSSISTEDLVAFNLLDQATLATFRTVKEFEDVEMRTGPATAVYLHHLSQQGRAYDSPVDCFNALKVDRSVLKVISNPLAISEGLSKDLISQIET